MPEEGSRRRTPESRIGRGRAWTIWSDDEEILVVVCGKPSAVWVARMLGMLAVRDTVRGDGGPDRIW
jgi:hypothetical protein